jgi:myo-inositol-1(or 4)-monophosphatase
MNEFKNVAIKAVKSAGKVLMKEYKNFNRKTVKLKSHHEILTKCDLMSEEIIIKEIKKNFPHHQILSEEMGKLKDNSDYLWIVDPLDGSTNFSIHNPLWAVSIALAHLTPYPLLKKEREKNFEIILGVIYAPFLDELYVTEKDKGAYLNSEKLKVSSIKEGKIINTFCHGREIKHIKKAITYYSKQKLKELDCRQFGSAALELAYVASGRIESITIPGANLWDIAAGVLLVREAGGWVTDFRGQEWNIESREMVASNGLVQREILRVINSK